MAGLQDRWNEVVEAACLAREAAEACEKPQPETANSPVEAAQAREARKNTTRQAYEALRETFVREYDGLWDEVLEQTRATQTIARHYFMAAHDPARLTSEREAAVRAFGAAKVRLLDLLAEVGVNAPSGPQPADSASTARGPHDEAWLGEPEDYPRSPEPWALTH